MQIQAPVPAYVPKSLAQALLSAKRSAELDPGLIVGIQDLSAQSSSFVRAINGLASTAPVSRAPAFVVSARETSRFFRHTEELALLKSVAALIAQQVHPHLKLGVDAVWLVYRAAQLHDEWSQPNADKVVCGFKLGGLVLSSANLAGGFYPDIKLPDCWSNGFNFALKSGEAIYQGKTVPVNELMFSADKRMDIPLKILKLAGMSLDAQPSQGLSGLNTAQRPTFTLLRSPALEPCPRKHRTRWTAG